MSAPIPLRRDFEASQLRGLARRTKDGPQARRLLALAAIYDGATRSEAAKIGDVGLQIVRTGRKRLAVHARKLALEPRVQIIRRSRRPLLRGLEQARRSALAHHVHRIAPMGPRVLISGTWY